MRNSVKKLHAIALVCVIIMLILGTCALSAHDCCGAECLVCVTIRRTLETMSTLSPVFAIFAFHIFAGRGMLRFPVTGRQTIFRSLLLSKTSLLS